LKLYSLIYLFFFLPVFTVLYRLLPAKWRKWLIAAANLAFIASGGIKGLIVYGVCLTDAYITGRALSKLRTRPDRISRCRALLASGVVLNAAALLFFSKGRGAELTPLSGFAVTGGAVIMLVLSVFVG